MGHEQGAGPGRRPFVNLNLRIDAEPPVLLRVHRPWVRRGRVAGLRRLRERLQRTQVRVARPIPISGGDLLRVADRWAEQFIDHVQPRADEDSHVRLFEELGRVPDSGETMELLGLHIEILEATDTHVVRARLGCLEHVIGAEHDTLVPVWKSKELAELIAGADYSVMPGAPHALNMERAEEFNQAVLDFIAERAPAPA